MQEVCHFTNKRSIDLKKIIKKITEKMVKKNNNFLVSTVIEI